MNSVSRDQIMHKTRKVRYGTLRGKENRRTWDKLEYIDHEDRQNVYIDDKANSIDDQLFMSISKSKGWNFLYLLPGPILFCFIFAWSIWKIGLSL